MCKRKTKEGIPLTGRTAILSRNKGQMPYTIREAKQMACVLKGLTKNEVETCIREGGRIDVLTNGWDFILTRDADFIKEFLE